MADNWIKLCESLLTSPKVSSMAIALGLDDPDYLIGKLARFWLIADKHTTDGRIERYTAAQIDRQVGLSGFAQSMQDVGWLEFVEGTAVIPRFEKHNSMSAKRRIQERDRFRKMRAEKKKPARIESVQTHAFENGSARNLHGICTENAREKPALEEKRREEKEEEEMEGLNPSKPSFTPDVGKPESAEPRSPIAKTRKTHQTNPGLWGKPPVQFDSDSGKWIGITESIRGIWELASPAVDIGLELAKAAAWVIANPTKKKRDYRKFLTTWLNRVQERGGSPKHAQESTRTPQVGQTPKLSPMEIVAAEIKARHEEAKRRRASEPKGQSIWPMNE